jgi:tetratricopeptide (TPR) repeat protein
VAGKILKAAQATIAVDDVAHSLHAVNVPTAAQEAYFKGRFLCNRWREQAVLRGILYLKEAISACPGFGAAYAALAEAYCLLYMRMPNASIYVEDGREAAEQALKIDPSLSEAHVAIGVVRMFADWNWTGAYEAFTRARTIQPGNPQASAFLGIWYALFGRFEEAAECLRVSLESDPLSILNLTRITWVLTKLQRYDEAEQRIRFALELDPQLPVLQVLMAHVYVRTGRESQGMELEQNALGHISELDSEHPFSLVHIALYSGSTELGKALLRQLKPEEFEKLAPGKKASMLAAAGSYEEALDQLEFAIKNREPYMLLLMMGPGGDLLKIYPRYQKLRRQIGLPPAM